LLTLRPVLKGNDREQLHRQMVDDTPPAPRALVRLIPRELETIVLKALSKDRDERYASAQEMADDLRRFLNDQPILARRPTVLQRLFRWARKHRTLVAVGVLMLAVVAVGLAFSTSIVSMQRDQIQAALSRNRDLLGKTQRAQALAAQANHELREHLYSVNIRLAYRAWHTADVGHAVRLLQEQIPRDNEVDYRGIEWRLLWQKLHTHRVELVGHRDEVYATAYSGDGKWLATGGKDTRVCVWNAATGELRYTIESHKLDVNGLAFRDDGRQLATVSEDGLVRLFDVSSGHQEHQLSGHALGVFCVQYIPGSDLLVSAGRGGTVRLWDSRRYEQLAHFTAHSDNIESIDVSPDGKLLATASRDDTIRLWDLETRQPVRTLKGHRDTVLAVAFSPDGKRLASGGEDLSVLLWDVATGKLVEQMQGHQEWIQSVAFASQGDVIVSASKDSTVRLWETSTGKSIDVLRGHRGRVWNATVSPDGHTLATAGADGAVKLWSWPAAQRHGAIRAQEHPFTALAVAPDGQLCAVADAQGWLTLLDISSGCTTRRMRVSDVGCQHVLFVANGASLVTASQDGKVRLWETATGELKAELCQCEQPILALRLHPSQTSVVCLSGDGKQHSILRVWQIDEPSEGMVVVHAPIGMACCAEFARDGGWLLLGKPDGELLALNWTSQEIACMWEGHPGRINEICLNADGTLLATSGQDGLIKIWSWPDCQLTHSLPGHSDTVRAMAFTADGRTLASGGEDGVTRLWNVATGQELTMLARFENRVGELAILPDDRGVIVLSDSVNDDGLAGWFTDATVWRQPLLHAPTE
jgi:WD40 repeat protein